MTRVRRVLRLRGRVQGVGLRPWAARRAAALGLAGHVANAGDGVRVTLEGESAAVEAWLAALRAEPPAGAVVEGVVALAAAPRGERSFRIRASAPGEAGAAAPRIPPDVPVCAACLRELFDPADRRHRHPFTHCAECGPRASVLLGLPWDRERTTLGAFAPCAGCAREYADPTDRRHHAQTLACPACGPRLRFRGPGGAAAAGDPLEAAAEQLRAGAIVALLGYGGFHLLCDATRPEAVARLRKRKARPAKPFALLVPGLDAARGLVRLTPDEEALLAGPLRPVLVAPRRETGCAALGLAAEVAPRTRDLGVALPCAPAHWLLLYGPGSVPGRDAPRFDALVFTSANRSGEPTLHRPDEAREALAGIADCVVEHDRRVARPSDDPVFRTGPEGPIPVRLSRGAAPRILPLPPASARGPDLAAVGGDLKAAPALAVGGEAWLAEHVGDLESVAATETLEERLAALARAARVEPTAVAHDLHPGYAGTALAGRLGLPTYPVQHHHAHAAACLVEHGLEGPVLAWVLDGAGHGDDGSVWGGELLRASLAEATRLAHLENVPLPGGDAAVREPWRMAAVWLARAFPDGAPALPWHRRRDPAALARVERIAARGVASPPTSSCGRLLDALASLLDQGDHATHEGEAAVALESLAAPAWSEALRREAAEREARRRLPADRPCGRPEPYEVPEAAARAAAAAAGSPSPRTVPVADLVRDAVGEHAAGAPPARTAARFHAALGARLVAEATRAARATGHTRVALSGGCLQSRLLQHALAQGLREAGLEPLLHRTLPPNDGGLAIGQLAVARARAATRSG